MFPAWYKRRGTGDVYKTHHIFGLIPKVQTDEKKVKEKKKESCERICFGIPTFFPRLVRVLFFLAKLSPRGRHGQSVCVVPRSAIKLNF